MIELTFVNGPEIGRTIQIGDCPVVFGRTADADVVLNWDGLVSSKHFRILPEDGQVFLVDLGSRNGTRVNGVSIQRKQLNDGDRIQIGSTQCVVTQRIVSATAQSPKSEGNVAPVSGAVRAERPRNTSPIESGILEPLHKPKSSVAENVARVDDTARAKRPSNTSPIENSISDFQAPFFASPKSQPVRTGPIEPASVSAPDVGPVQKNDRNLPSDQRIVIKQVRLRVVDAVGHNVAKSLVWLAPGQMLSVGRSPICDCCIEGDSSMSQHHFKIECDDQACRVVDLQSRDGTWLNGERVLSQAQLFHGDRLSAGKTHFTIEVETHHGFLLRSDAPAAASTADPSVLLDERRTAQRARGQKLAAVKVACPSGLYLLRGTFPEDVSATALIKALVSCSKVYLLLDFARIERPYPSAHDVDSSKLFHWLPTVAAVRSTHLFALKELTDWPEYVNEAYGTDAAVILLSEADKPVLLTALRESLRDPTRGREASQAMLGFCWPAVLNALLEQGVQEFPSKFFEHVNAAVFEGSAPGSWQLFARDEGVGSDIISRCSQAGLGIEVQQP